MYKLPLKDEGGNYIPRLRQKSEINKRFISVNIQNDMPVTESSYTAPISEYLLHPFAWKLTEV